MAGTPKTNPDEISLRPVKMARANFSLEQFRDEQFKSKRPRQPVSGKI
jgi:hypothetical protein